MDEATRRLVRERAADCCEYCRLPQEWSPMARLHVEHIRPRKHGGPDDDGNLALACVHCNSHKGSNLTGIDPDTGEIAELFNPRTQDWNDHFSWEGIEIIGLTPCGRATVRVLNMNAERAMYVRLAGAERG
jgi:hypothetical protein